MTIIFSAALLLMGSFIRMPEAADSSVKAMFIYNFSKYFDWSQTATKNNFTIAVFGKTEITEQLKQIAERKQLNGKPVVIKPVYNTSSLEDAQMLFVSGNNHRFLKEVNKSVNPGSLIIITESQGSNNGITHINLVNVSNKLGFELNETKLKIQQVKFSKELSTLAVKSY